MPPQPVSRIKPGIKYRLHFDNLDEGSAPAQAVAECIGKWSVVDTNLGYIFIALLQSNEGQGAELYASLESAKAKMSAIKALAVASLSAAENDLLLRLLRYVTSQQKLRDKLAHWLIGTSDQLPNSIILADPKSAWVAMGKNRQAFREAVERKSNEPFRGTPIPVDKIYAWDLQSLQADRDAFASLAILLVSFIKLCSSDPRSLTRQQLFEEITRDTRLAEHKAR